MNRYSEIKRSRPTSYIRGDSPAPPPRQRRKQTFRTVKLDCIPTRPARQLDKARFARQYQAFKAGKEDQQSGTPLNVVPFMTPAKAEEYKFFNIATVEQLAGAMTEKLVELFDEKPHADTSAPRRRSRIH